MNYKQIKKEFREKFMHPDYMIDEPSENIEDFWRLKIEKAIDDMIGENRDAYKVLFSEAQIKQELLQENRDKKRMANNYYKKGRDDEYNQKVQELKEYKEKFNL